MLAGGGAGCSAPILLSPVGPEGAMGPELTPQLEEPDKGHLCGTGISPVIQACLSRPVFTLPFPQTDHVLYSEH
ncbi:hypothetical protein AAFF_G00224210 [Aldrovandia affinis]|uniref:Uncharacterized protein n=1 Tax=Aldrovandia affinis TaxID=143900 RepID=A0AAD7TB86_9TELE|nr:hypothetical protein AAFF_G00224210 [Aldrovandia affinis]